MSKKNIIVFIISLIVLVVLILLGTSLTKNTEENPETGHFYGKPKSIEDIRTIDIVYNNGKDYIFISNKKELTYFTFDKEGKMVYKTYEIDTSDIIKYIYENDIDYLKEDKHIDNEKWSLEVSSPGSSCIISKKTNQPEWFDELLEKLEVDKKGYLSKTLK